MALRNYLFYLLLLFPFVSNAALPFQAKTDSVTSDTTVKHIKHSYLLMSMDMGNNFSYMDRTSQSTYPYINPNVLFKAKSGFFFLMGAYGVKNVRQDYNISPWVEMDLGTGWKFKLGENTMTGISYVYSAYDRSFPLLSSALSNNISAYYNHDFSIVDSRLSFNYAFGKLGGDSVVTTRKVGKKKGKSVEKATFFTSSDYFLNLDLSHEFDWDDVFTKDDEISFEPQLTISSGTNNFYNNYYKKVKYTTLRKNQKLAETDTISDPYDATAAAFKLREYILAFPLGYSIGRFDFSIEYLYIIPVNQPEDPAFRMDPYSMVRVSLNYRIRSKK